MLVIVRKGVLLPNGVEVKYDSSTYSVEVSGPKGFLKNLMDRVIITQDSNIVSVSIKSENANSLDSSRLQGLYRAMLSNMVKGVSTGFEKKLELIGVGYKANLITKNILELDLGYSHKVLFCIPNTVSCAVSNDKGKNVIIVFTSCDKCLVGQICAKIKSLRSVEPYKGKGFRYFGEFVKLKLGKKAKK